MSNENISFDEETNLVCCCFSFKNRTKKQLENLVCVNQSDCEPSYGTILKYGINEVYNPQSWRESFDKLMHSDTGRNQFLNFIILEHSEDNLIFWEKCESLRCVKNKEEEVDLINHIYDNYIKELSPHEVNLPAKIVKDISIRLTNPNINIFSEAQKEVYRIMQQECYPRFLESSFYKETLKQNR